MGTPEFAVPSLEILIENGYQVVAVITSTDKRGGRGGKRLLQSAVKKFAVGKGIPVLQPRNLKAPAFLEELESYRADLQVVVAFRMLPLAVWDMPRIGTFNLHGSLLPKYRGAAPINWAVINGEEETGVTTFFIKHEIDTGDILFQEKMPIGPDETAGEVHDRMMHIGAKLVLKTVRAIEKGGYRLQRQDESLVCKAPKIFHETCEVDFTEKTKKVHDFIRGLSPYPCAWTTIKEAAVLENGTPWEADGWENIKGKQLKIYRSKMIEKEFSFPAGQLLTDGKKHLYAATADGFIEILELQLQGRKRMRASDFLNGLRS
ncbi:MAG TPA: methionyl-tRNA formyltransferase [Bacteroidetes bacterium]|nr:methionyl-tRNA formyltransferase [Bacteroidota bacterium]